MYSEKCRFEDLIYKDSKTGCWEWTAVKNERGYGVFMLKGKTKLAHRVAYEIYKGEIPEGIRVCHSCDNPSCQNPDHLWLGNQSDNLKDCVRKNRNSKTVEAAKRNGAINGRKGARKLRFFSDDEVREIRLSTKSCSSLAIEHMVGKTTIQSIRARLSYKDVV